jgi:hypothetical protein
VEEDTRGVCRAHDHSLALCGACASCSHCVLLSHHRHPRTTDERRRDKTLFNVGGAVAAFVYEGGCRWPAPPVAGIHHYSRCRTAAHALHLTRMRSELSSRATQHAHRNADTAPLVRNEACRSTLAIVMIASRCFAPPLLTHAAATAMHALLSARTRASMERSDARLYLDMIEACGGAPYRTHR